MAPTKRVNRGSHRDAEQHRHTRRLIATPVTIAAMALAACGGGGADQADRAVGADADRSVAAPGAGDGEAIMIKTSLTVPTGEVLPGSVIGDSRFCPGGTFRDEERDPGSVLRTFRCPDGRLRIVFSPRGEEEREIGPIKQSGPWEVLSGSGRFRGLRGHGRMKVTFKQPPVGRETFTGTVVE